MSVKIDTQQFRANVRVAAFKGLVRATEHVRNEVVRLLTSSSHSGRTYIRRGVAHQASAPGEPPATDTGRLVGSIRTEYDEAQMVGRVIASTKYAAMLEFGTQRMEPRPFMRPALENSHDEIVNDIKTDVMAVVKEVGP